MRFRAVVVLLLAMVAVAVAAAWRPILPLADTRPPINLESLFPKSFGTWTLDDRMPVQLVSPDTAAVLDKIYNQTLSRTYVNKRGERIMLSVAYGGDQSDGTRAHRPEVCYPAQGFQILSEQRDEVALHSKNLRVRRLVAKLADRVEPITYWTTVGDRLAVSGTEQKLAQLSYSTRGFIPDGMLVRVSNIDADAKSAFERQSAFIRELAIHISVDAQPQVIGATENRNP
ncbi:exosortase-associated protein EpsI, B-type [Piscinibacter sakaiensis]|uniref:exosortase-associated protein EpsI, B-type n=1 Tax=Piscinibacter sakaiensis TaxID=1547922 RepID=UPI003AAE5A6A